MQKNIMISGELHSKLVSFKGELLHYRNFEAAKSFDSMIDYLLRNYEDMKR